jgi:hypothetical protein
MRLAPSNNFVALVSTAILASILGFAYHNDRLRLDDLPDWDWCDISAHLKCTRCGTIGYVDTRVDWSEVINFNKGIG